MVASSTFIGLLCLLCLLYLVFCWWPLLYFKELYGDCLIKKTNKNIYKKHRVFTVDVVKFSYQPRPLLYRSSGVSIVPSQFSQQLAQIISLIWFCHNVPYGTVKSLIKLVPLYACAQTWYPANVSSTYHTIKQLVPFLLPMVTRPEYSSMLVSMLSRDKSIYWKPVQCEGHITIHFCTVRPYPKWRLRLQLRLLVRVLLWMSYTLTHGKWDPAV